MPIIAQPALGKVRLLASSPLALVALIPVLPPSEGAILEVAAPVAQTSAGAIGIENVAAQQMLVMAVGDPASVGSISLANVGAQLVEVSAVQSAPALGSVALDSVAPQSLVLGAPASGSGVGDVSAAGVVGLVLDIYPLPITSTAGEVSTSNLSPQSIAPIADGSGSTVGNLALSNVTPQTLAVDATGATASVGAVSLSTIPPQLITITAPGSGSYAGSVSIGEAQAGNLEITAPAVSSSAGSISAAKATPQAVTVSAPVAVSVPGNASAANATPQPLSVTASASTSSAGSVSVTKATAQGIAINAPASISTSGNVTFTKLPTVFRPDGTSIYYRPDGVSIYIRPEYDSDAQAYFEAVETAGGSFDLTAIDPVLTAGRVKWVTSDFVTGLKADGLWTKTNELYLLCGKTYSGIGVKLKGTGSLTLYNFASGNLIPAGPGAGLAANGVDEYIDTGFEAGNISPQDSHLGVYYTAAWTDSWAVAIGAKTASGDSDELNLLRPSDGATARFIDSATQDYADGSVTLPAYIIGTCSASRKEVYINGSSVTEQSEAGTARASGEPQKNLFIFAINSGGTAQSHGDGTMALAHAGSELFDTDALNFKTRVEAFMVGLNAGVI